MASTVETFRICFRGLTNCVVAEGSTCVCF